MVLGYPFVPLMEMQPGNLSLKPLFICLSLIVHEAYHSLLKPRRVEARV